MILVLGDALVLILIVYRALLQNSTKFFIENYLLYRLNNINSSRFFNNNELF